LIDERVAIDGGSLGFALSSEEIGRVRDIIVTHTHSDHIASLPIYVAESFTVLDGPITIHGTQDVVTSLRNHVFNDRIWPDFERIQLPDDSGPTLRFNMIEPYRAVSIAGMKFTPVPVNHAVPTVGLIVEDERATLAFTSDTYVTDEIWREAAAATNLKAVFVDVSYPNELIELAEASKHLTPELLELELAKLDREVEILVVHIKPMNRADVISQLMELDRPGISVGEINRIYQW
jgi:cAMP phosphodiesterase